MTSSETARDPKAARLHPLPDLPAHYVGRDEQARDLEAKLLACRLVSIVGAGGLGKTTIAVAVARRMARVEPDGVCFLDLASLSDGEQVAARLAAALGIEAAGDRAAESVLQHLRGRRMLLVLDSCETAIDAAARIAEDILSDAPGVLLLVTSREPLQAAGEWVHRLEPLPWPPSERSFPAWLAMTYPAVQLFYRIAQDRHAELAASQFNADRVAALCRQLEGSPLAIALAASQVARLGLEGVAAQVASSVLTLAADTGGPRRHQTLEAVLAWSYRLLSDAEQRAFRNLALFRGSFDLMAALAVAGEGRRADATAAVLDLVEKSLLATLQIGEAVHYRMADSTRAFAERQLAPADATSGREPRRRHAQYLVQLLDLAEQRWLSMERVEWQQRHGPWIEDVRYALKWAFSVAGDALLAIELTVRAFGLADQTALFPDYQGFVLRALEQVGGLEPPRPDLALRLRTFPALDQLRALTENPRQLETLLEAVEVGRAEGSAASLLGALVAVFAHRFQHGDYPSALNWSLDIQKLAEVRADAVVDLTARRTRAQALHFLGDHAAAAKLAIAVCSEHRPGIPLAYTPSPVSTHVSMRIVLARIHWIEGRADQALRLVEECLERASREAAQSACQVLALAALPIGLWCGRTQACQRWLDQLAELAERREHLYWRAWSHFFALQLGRTDGAARREALPATRQAKFRDHLATLDATAPTEDSFARVEAGIVGWCAPEVLRVRAEQEIARGALDAAAIHLARANELARSQGALAWELRGAITAMRLSALTGDAAAGRAMLASVYGRFTEGFSTRDLQDARAILTGG